VGESFGSIEVSADCAFETKPEPSEMPKAFGTASWAFGNTITESCREEIGAGACVRAAAL
jgi:hypothetical protein